MTASIGDDELRGAAAFQQLHWLASGRIDAARLAVAYRAAIARGPVRGGAFVTLDESAPQRAAASDARRRDGSGAIGRLDGLPVAIKDNLDVTGLPTTVGLAGRRERNATRDAGVVAALRAAGAVILGKTALDEGAFGTTGANPHHGDVSHPLREGWCAGGSSAGSAVAVARGLCAFAIGSDTLGSVRIPASHCGVFGLKPTFGEIPATGLVHAARRLDTIGVLARSAQDLAIVLQVLDRFDAADPRSRRRRVPLVTPDWEPGSLRCGVLRDLSSLGVAPDVVACFERALTTCANELPNRSDVDFADYDFARTRRAALLVMEAELGVEFAGDDADAMSPRLRKLLAFARGKSAVEYAAADRMLDAAALKARRMFDEIDVLVLPTVPHGPYPFAGGERANDADLTSFASIAGCPAVSLPMGTGADGLPLGLQLVGAPGSDLRLLDLAEIIAATLDAAPAYPLGS
jgi:aspartyl-tRNA(Asn)/glutamyl-tRNA(Gln) amidotransferase subunit A